MYSQCANSAEVVEAQNRYLEKADEERERILQVGPSFALKLRVLMRVLMVSDVGDGWDLRNPNLQGEESSELDSDEQVRLGSDLPPEESDEENSSDSVDYSWMD